MKKLTFSLLILAASTVASASTAEVIFGGLPATQGNGTSVTNPTNIYDGEIPATIAGISNQDLVCDDFDVTTNVSNGNEIDFSVETIANLTGADFTHGFVTGLTGETGTMSETQAYETAAVLVAGLEALGTETNSNKVAVADYNFAIWQLMEPNTEDGSVPDSPLDTAAQGYLQSAFSAVIAGTPTTATKNDESNLVIYTPTSTNQEFLGMNTSLGGGSSPTPEPSSWLLLAAFGMLFGVPQVRSRLSATLSRS